MAWPTIFANLAAGNQPLSIFDNMFNQVAQLVAIPCTASGANAIVLTGIGNSPTLTAYNNFQAFRFKAAGNSTLAITVQFAGLAALPAFQKDGVTQCAAGSTIGGNEYLVVFDQSRNAGAGGFYLEDAAQPVAQGASPIWGPFTNVASASTTDLSTATTIAVTVTGNATITSFGAGVNLGKVVRFSGTPLLTNGASLVLPGGANIQAAAGDTMIALSNASAVWFVVAYSKASGQPIATGAAGIPLIGSGAGVDNAFGTAVVAGGGTGATTLTAHGVLIGEGTSPIAATAVGAAGQVLTSNGAGNDPTFQALPGGGGAITGVVQLLTASQTVTIPTGATKCKVTLIGGGAGSGGAVGAGANCTTPGASGAAGPGGPAAVLVKYLSGLTPGNTLVLTIGAAGSAGASTPTAGGNGGDTTLASGTQTITTLTAGKGSGGGSAQAAGGVSATGAVGAGGTATNGDLNINGGTGTAAAMTGSVVNNNAGTLALSIAASNGLFGPGPSNSAAGGTAVAGKAGTGFGAGAAGGASAGGTAVAGAVGTAGAAIFEWYI